MTTGNLKRPCPSHFKDPPSPIKQKTSVVSILTDEEHDKLDIEITHKLMSSRLYNREPPLSVILSYIALHSNGTLRETDIQQAEELIMEHGELETNLQTAWELKNYKAIRDMVIMQRTITPSSSNESNASVPSISRYWSPRHTTVRYLYNVLLKEKLVQVRGTPGCGKTTLMKLLHSYILKHTPSTTFINTASTWPTGPAGGLESPGLPIQSDSALTERLKQLDPFYPRPGPEHSLAFLLFDEGQDSYKDHILWNNFFKGVSDGAYDRYRIIIFCSYGSPSSRPVPRHITPLALSNTARISLWPRAGLGAPVGILLTRSEFDEVVTRFERQLNLQPDLQDLIFDWTVGHAGAATSMLRVISYQNDAETRHGVPFTVEIFHDKNPTYKLIESVCNGGAFERGIPTAKELMNQPNVVALLRKLLRNGAVDEETDKGDLEAIHMCHCFGWIHASPTAIDEENVHYAFPSPLHAACISWRLKPTNNMPEFPSLFDLALQAISRFKPSQLQLPIRRVNPTVSTDKPPEAQYQDEFYRSIFSLTGGNVCLSPEFASAREVDIAGRIDFFIPIMKWGIEITREGSRLAEHNSRFAESGAYGTWLTAGDMFDYIFLDCRTSIPQKKHSDFQNLFHVVFQDGYQTVRVYNNMVEQVAGPIQLLENH